MSPDNLSVQLKFTTEAGDNPAWYKDRDISDSTFFGGLVTVQMYSS